MTTALAVIDMQIWMFRTPERMAKLSKLITGVNRALEAAAAHSWLIYEIRTEWTNDPQAWSLRTRKDNEPVLLAGSRDVETVAGLLLPAGRDTVIKTRHSAFVRTDFEDRLKAKNVSLLLLAGGWLDGCVGQTAIDAYERDINTVILADAIASIDDARGDFVREWADHLGDIPCMPLDKAIGRAASP
jgi:maleamate amidohydrolase